MKSLLHQSRLSRLMQQRNGYLVLCAGLLALCLLLTGLCFYLSDNQRTLVIPPVIERAFWVTNHAVSPAYLTDMTLFFVELRLNVTPETAAYQQGILLRYTDAQYYGQFKEALLAERQQMAQEQISSTFYPADMQVNAPALQAIVSGDLQVTVGNTPLPRQRVAYLIHYRYDNGRLLVNQFEEVKPNAKL